MIIQVYNYRLMDCTVMWEDKNNHVKFSYLFQ